MEIIVGLALLLLALLGVYGLVRGSMQSFGISEDFLEVQQNARVALGQIAEEAKWAKSIEVGTANCPNPNLDPQCLSLLVPRDDPQREPEDPPVERYQVAFRWNGKDRQVERVVMGKKPAALADYVSDMTFTYMDNAGQVTSNPSDVVRIVADLTLRRRTTAVAQEVRVGRDIFLRNAVPTYGPATPAPPTPPRTPPTFSTRPPGFETPTPTPPPPPSSTPRQTPTQRRTRTPPPPPTPTVRPR